MQWHESKSTPNPVDNSTAIPSRFRLSIVAPFINNWWIDLGTYITEKLY